MTGSALNGGRRRKRTMRGGMGYGFQLNQEGGIVGAPAGNWSASDGTAAARGGPTGVGGFDDPSRGGNASGGGRRRRGSRKTRRSVATIKRLLKAKGLKVSGSRRALTARARKARIPMKGGGMVTGTPYESFTGNGVAGGITPFMAANPVSGNVITRGGYGLRTAESGGGVEA
jgi:hypothetical protein